MGAVFQLPTVVLFLARIGLVTPGFLWKNTKYAILVIFVVAAVITPERRPGVADDRRGADDRALRAQHRHRVGSSDGGRTSESRDAAAATGDAGSALARSL